METAWEDTTTTTGDDTERAALALAYAGEPARDLLVEVALFMNLPPDTPPDLVWLLAEVYQIATSKIR